MLTDTDVEEGTMEEVAYKAFQEDKPYPSMTLPANHWRYQALHWAFDIKKGQRHSNETYYCRYCPLFHMTNLIVVGFLPILAFKIMRAIVMGTIVVCNTIGVIFDRTVGVLFRKWLESKVKAKQALKDAPLDEGTLEEIRARLKKKEIRDIYAQLRGSRRETYLKHFSVLYYDLALNHVSQDELKEIWQSEVDKHEKTKLIIEARRKRIQSKMVFWVNFSQIFIKGILNTMYVAMAAGVAYGAYAFGWPVVSTVAGWVIALAIWMWNTDYLLVAKFILKCISGLLTLGAVCLAGYYIGIPAAKKVGASALPPIRLVRNVGSAFVDYVDGIIESTKEFVSMYYHNNCPRITIIEETPIQSVGDDL